MQSCWDDGCFSSGLRPWEVIVVIWLLRVRTKMIRLHAYQHLAPPFTQVTTLFFHNFFSLHIYVFLCFLNMPGVYRNSKRAWMCFYMQTFAWYNPLTWLPVGSLPSLFCHPLSYSLVFSVFSHLMSSALCRITREHRENLSKLAKQLSNKAKDSLRRVRANAVTQVKKAKEGHSEDTIRLLEKQVWDREREKDNGAIIHRDRDIPWASFSLVTDSSDWDMEV